MSNFESIPAYFFSDICLLFSIFHDIREYINLVI